VLDGGAEVEGEVDLAAEQVDHHLLRSLVGDMDHVELRLAGEHLGGHVLQGAVSG